jgi:hypothetical protein
MTYIPKNKKLRDEIIELHHDQLMMGHVGPEGTKGKIQRGFWWPRMHENIMKYCQACDRCQRTKADRTKRHALLRPNLIPNRPWQIISWDLIGPLPESNGYNAMFVVVDRHGKRAIVQECNTTITSEGAARIFRDRVFRNHGMPETIISDRGSQFNSGFMKELCRLLEINKTYPRHSTLRQMDKRSESTRN